MNVTPMLLMLGTTLLGMVPVTVMGQTFKCGWDAEGNFHYHAFIGGKNSECDPMASALNSMKSKTDALGGKADKSYVDQLRIDVDNNKPTKSYVDQQLNLKATTASVDAKADKSYVDQIKKTTDASVITVNKALNTLNETMYSKAEVDAMFSEMKDEMKELLADRRQREADRKNNIPKAGDGEPGANDDGNGNGNGGSTGPDDENNGDGDFSVGVAVGATVPSVLLVGVLIAFIATRNNQGAGRQAGRTQQRGGKKAAARRGRQPARARHQQDSPQRAYGQAASNYSNPTFSNAGDATYEEIDEDVEVMDANANTDVGYDMPDGLSANDNVQDDYGNDQYVEVMDAVADAVTDANELDYC